MDKGRLICKERMDGGVVQLEAVLHQKRPMIRRVRLLGERTLSDAPATGRTMKGHLTAASHGDLRCCVKYIRRFSFLFVSSPFFGFCVALQSSYLTDLDRSARWPLVAGDVTAVGVATGATPVGGPRAGRP